MLALGAPSWFLSCLSSSPQTCRTGPLIGLAPTHPPWRFHELKPGCVCGGGMLAHERGGCLRGDRVGGAHPFSAHGFWTFLSLHAFTTIYLA